MRYLSAQDILVMHAKLVDETGGAHGVRDLGLLASLTERPKTSFGGKEIYKTIFEKAATYLESLAKYHVFIDGNKRTAITSCARFLYINGYGFAAKDGEIEKFVLKIIEKDLHVEEITRWVKQHSKKN